jgi:hypothetical protein
VTREIVYRLFMGAQGSRLGHIVAIGGPTQRIVEAIERLRSDFHQLPHRLPQRLALQSRVQAAVRRDADARRGAPAGWWKGKCWRMSR